MYEEYKDLAKRIRKNCLHMCYVGQGGHIGSMLSAADIMAVLYGGGEHTADVAALTHIAHMQAVLSDSFGKVLVFFVHSFDSHSSFHF